MKYTKGKLIAKDNEDHITKLTEMYEVLKDIIEQAEKTKLMIPADLSDSIHMANSLIKSIES